MCTSALMFPSSVFSRHLVPGRHPIHAGVRLCALPGGQRQRDAHHDHGLQVLLPQAHLAAVQEVRHIRKGIRRLACPARKVKLKSPLRQTLVPSSFPKGPISTSRENPFSPPSPSPFLSLLLCVTAEWEQGERTSYIIKGGKSVCPWGGEGEGRDLPARSLPFLSRDRIIAPYREASRKEGLPL